MRKIKEIIIHCTACRPNKTPQAIKQEHIRDNGWKDVGYHFLIDSEGHVWRGRDVSEVGAHCTGRNTNSIGIAYIGGLNIDNKPANTMTRAQMVAMFQLLEVLKMAFNIDNDNVRLHNEFANKACPCFKPIEFWEMMQAVAMDFYFYRTTWFNL